MLDLSDSHSEESEGDETVYNGRLSPPRFPDEYLQEKAAMVYNSWQLFQALLLGTVIAMYLSLTNYIPETWVFWYIMLAIVIAIYGTCRIMSSTGNSGDEQAQAFGALLLLEIISCMFYFCYMASYYYAEKG